jgi:hypothetical protein
VITSAGGEATPGREKGGDASWADMNLLGQKTKKKNIRSIQLLQMDDEDLKATIS